MNDSKVVDQFAINESLAKGSYGNCFRATYLRNANVYSLRILGSEFKERDIVDAKIPCSANKTIEGNSFQPLGHYGTWQGSSYLASPYASGEDLASLIKRQGPMELSQGLVCIVRALECFMSEANDSVGHGQLRPSKLILNRNGRVCVRDLPLAKLLQIRKPLAWQKLEALPIHHAEYMAPELAFNEVQPSFRTDIYGLGCILYFLFTGKPVFKGTDAATIARLHREASIPLIGKSLSNVPNDLETCFRKMLAKKPSERFASYQHCHATLKALAQALNRTDNIDSHWNVESSAAKKRIVKAEPTEPHLSPKSKWAWIAAIACALAVATAVFMFTRTVVKDAPRTIQTVKSEDSFQLP